MMVEYTLGPWHWAIRGTRQRRLWTLEDPLHAVILTAEDDEFGPHTNPDANRCLIAAAPDLYAALDRLTETLGQMPAGKRQRAAMVDAYEAAIAAMNKATGARAAGPGEDG